MGETSLITLDTSGALALLNRRDPDHESVKSALRNASGPYIVPMGIMAEIAYLVETRLGASVMDAFLQDLETGEFSLDFGGEDIPRIRELAAKYHDLPLGFADACAVACAERNRGRVLTLDLRHFGIVAREGRITILP